MRILTRQIIRDKLYFKGPLTLDKLSQVLDRPRFPDLVLVLDHGIKTGMIKFNPLDNTYSSAVEVKG